MATTITLSPEQQQPDRQPSDKLLEAIDNCVFAFNKTKDAVNIALEIGEKEGFHPRFTGNLIRKRLLEAGFHRNTVANVLPPIAKYAPRGSVSTKIVQTQLRQQIQLQPHNYNSEDLTKYTKQFLIEIIQYLEKKYDIPKPKPIINIPIDRASNDKERQIIELHNEGKSSRVIASIVGIGKSSVQRILTRN